MDETVINGAQLFYPDQFGLHQTPNVADRNSWLLGLVNSAPYVSITSTEPMIWLTLNQALLCHHQLLAY